MENGELKIAGYLLKRIIFNFQFSIFNFFVYLQKNESIN